MKKRLSTSLCALACALSFAGCSDASSSVQTEATPEETTTVAPAETTVETTEETTTEAPVTYNGIKDLFAEHGLKAGVALTTDNINNSSFWGIFLQNFNSLTMGNEMKADYILDKEKSIAAGDLVVDFKSNTIKTLDWAKKNNFSMRGHTLVWYSQTPDWIFYEDFDTTKSLVDRDTMLARLDSYIHQVFTLLEEGDYLDMFYAYDVVNEAWMENGSMRDNYWLQTIGDDYLWQSFYIADKYAPESVDLYYNDYNEQYKADTLLKFVETLKDEDGRYLIDGIGLQAHLYTNDDLDTYFKALDKLATSGLKIQLTELDVCLGSWNNPGEANDANFKLQGLYYYNLIKGVLERVDNGTLKSDALTIWGFADGLSWRKEYSPLIYDRMLMPKPSYYGVMQQLDMIK